MCPMNCHPTYCGMVVEIGEDGRALSVSGDPDNPDSRGFLCVRGRAAVEIPHNERRLSTPLRRRGGRGEPAWDEIGWPEALDVIASRIIATRPDRVGVWFGHGAYVTTIARPLIMRFGHLSGFQVWNPAVICWALGAYGLALTGVLEAHTKEDLAAHSNLVILWGANLASQPTTAPHLVEARRRGARVVVIDVRRTEAARHADEVYLLRPGSDAALALAIAHVLVAEERVDREFIARHTVGFDAYAASLAPYSPAWAAAHSGLSADAIARLARLYATTTPAMIVVGGSSMFKHRHGWQPGRAIATLPALTGQLGIPGGGLGPRHRSFPTGDGFADLAAADRRPPGAYVPSHMPSMLTLIEDGGLDVLLLLGTDLLSSFADAGRLERALDRVGLIVAFDIFPNQTIRRVADLVLPGTVWLEELGLKDTATHLYLMDRALAPRGEARPLVDVLRELARRIRIPDFFPWADTEDYLRAYLAPQHEGRLTVSVLREAGGRVERGRLSHVPYGDHRYPTPSGKIEFYSERAASLGLPPLPAFTPIEPDGDGARFGLEFRQGRTLTAFHAFYDAGRALPTLARMDPAPALWIHPADAAARRVASGQAIELYNERGVFAAVARVTEDTQPGVVWMRDGWPGLNVLTSGAPCLSPHASGGLDPRIPGGQAAFEARVEVRTRSVDTRCG
jgi:anaerobic selenocysteine-containing dehydrogenase